MFCLLKKVITKKKLLQKIIIKSFITKLKIWAGPLGGYTRFVFGKDYKKNNYYYNVENLSKASGGGIHIWSSEKIITNIKLSQKNLNYYRFYYKIENFSRDSGGGIYTRFVFWKDYYKEKSY